MSADVLAFRARDLPTDGGKARILSRREEIWREREHPDPKDIRDVVVYDSETGIFRWQPRPVTDRFGRAFNTKWAGTVAGSINRDGYRYIKIGDLGSFAAHRLAWAYVNGQWPDTEIDHIDRNPDNNRLANLRLASREQNCANSKVRSTNTSGIRGVSLLKPEHRWRPELCWVANIRIDGKCRNLGHFATKEAAGAAYDTAARAYYGQYYPADLAMDHADPCNRPSDSAYNAPDGDCA